MIKKSFFSLFDLHSIFFSSFSFSSDDGEISFFNVPIVCFPIKKSLNWTRSSSPILKKEKIWSFQFISFWFIHSQFFNIISCISYLDLTNPYLRIDHPAHFLILYPTFFPDPTMNLQSLFLIERQKWIFLIRIRSILS